MMLNLMKFSLRVVVQGGHGTSDQKNTDNPDKSRQNYESLARTGSGVEKERNLKKFNVALM